MRKVVINNKEQLIRLLRIVKEGMEFDIYPFTVALEVKDGEPFFTIQGKKASLSEVEKLWSRIG